MTDASHRYRLINKLVVEYRLRRHDEKNIEWESRQAAIRNFAVQLGIYDSFNQALAASEF